MQGEDGVSLSPYPTRMARQIMRKEFGLGVKAQDEILSAIAEKAGHQPLDDSEFEKILRSEISLRRKKNG